MSLVIQVEGIDGSGKSTMVAALAKHFHEMLPTTWVYASKEPGSPWSGKSAAQIREMVLNTPDFKPIERRLLFLVDSSLHTRFIQNQGNAIIISDRGIWSHLAYLRAYLKTGQIDHEDYLLCKKLINRVCTSPDCVLYLQGSLDLMKQRSVGKKLDMIEANNDAFFNVVHETYENLREVRELENKPLISVDASLPICTNLDKIVQYLKEAFSHEELTSGNRIVC